MVTTGIDKQVRVWDIEKQTNVLTFGGAETSYGIDWSHNGSLLALVGKDKNLYWFDPRTDTSCSRVPSHEGAKQQRLTWLGDSQTILTCGFSKLSQREYAIWDIRNTEKPLIKRQLDDYMGVPTLHFDDEQSLLYVAGRGESAISFFQFSRENPNFLNFLTSYKGKEPQKGFALLPKKSCDLLANEVNRCVRLTSKTVEYVSFKVPRKSGNF